MLWLDKKAGICNGVPSTEVWFDSDVRPTDKSLYLIIIFFISQPKKNVVGTQKNRLNEMVLYSTQNTCLN